MTDEQILAIRKRCPAAIILDSEALDFARAVIAADRALVASQAQPAAERGMPPVYVYRRAGATYTTLVDPRPFKNTDSAPIEWFAVYEPAL